MDDKARLRELYLKKERLIKETALDYYDPYSWQVDFHNDKDPHRCLVAANKVGKTFCGAPEAAYHLTGQYPDWWEGTKFRHPIKLVGGGKNNEKTRDILQAGLFGDPAEQGSWGTGWIPKASIGSSQRKPGVPDAKFSVSVKHFTDGVYDGMSKVTFLAYDMGKETWMAHEAHVNWLDEEPPEDIMAQANRSTIATGGILFMTFTPENGTTGVVKMVFDQWSVHKVGWLDVSGDDFDIDLGGENLHFSTVYTMKGNKGHLTKEKVFQAKQGTLPHEIRMRAFGEPVLGSGLVFPYPERQISIEPIDIPDHWRRIAAIDFGYTHPTAIVWLAWDEATDTIYVYDALRIFQKEIPEIASRIISRPSQWIPIMYPHDGNKHTSMGGTVKEQYAKYGVNMGERFTNPPEDNKPEGTGGIAINPGIVEISARINDGRFKVFNTLPEWFQEYRQYHIEKGKIVDVDEDLMSATRYAVQSLRYSIIEKDVSEWESNDWEDNVRDYASAVTGY